MNYDNIKINLVNALTEVEKEIYSLDASFQNQIFNEDILPDDPVMLFLNNSYYSLNEMILNLNKLTVAHQ